MNLPLELESLLRPKLSTIQSKRYCFLSCHVNWKTHWGEPERAPHYSGTALRKCVNVRTYVLACLRPYTVNFKYAFKYFPKIELKGNTGPECSVDNHSGDSSSLTPTVPYFLFVTTPTDWPSTADYSQTVKLQGLNTFTSFDAPPRDMCGWSMHIEV